MRHMYPEIEPFDTGLLDVGEGHQIYYEVSGNPDGKAAVYLHGGPGGASSPDQRRVFDPAKYRIVLFDQRGCGKSLPHASAPEADLSTNTTWHIVADIEALRAHLDIDTWLVCGGSWGSALALAYAGKHRERVAELVLRGIFTLRKSELDWFYEGGAANVYPDLWEGFVAPVPEDQRGRLIEAYSRLLNDPDPAVHVPAAKAWARWESSAITLLPNEELVAHFTEDAFAVAFARIENHFFMNAGWFDDGQLIDEAAKLKDVPGVIIQGRYDMCTPATTAWDLHRAWPEAEFRMILDAGHAFTEAGILSAIVEATDRFAS
jgi:proline iminopeptidase